MPETLLTVTDLSVEFRSGRTTTPITDRVGFEIARGETLALVGESGSGKSVTAMAVARLLPANARCSGEVIFNGEDLLRATPARMRHVQGSGVAMVFQEPMTALNPVHRIGKLLDQAISSHATLSRAELADRRMELLEIVGLPDPARRLEQYPHQLSGGQRQRAMIAMAIAGDPELLIADEPTTALDVTAQAEVLDLLESLQERLGMSVLMITHDMGVVADIADRVIVMNDGAVVEEAATEELFRDPRADYTRELLGAVPHLGQSEIVRGMPTTPTSVIEQMATERRFPEAEESSEPALDIGSLVVEYPGRGRERFRAVDDVSFRVGVGDVVGLVGESGSGKSTIGRAIVGLAPISGGGVNIHGVDVARVKGRQARAIRREVAMVFQDPVSSLNPRATIGESISAPLRWNRVGGGPLARKERVAELLERVRLPESWAHRYPHELSGGQRQRVGIARALALQPRVLIADEPTSALDVSVQAAVLELLMDLQRDLGFSCVFISHDLSVVEQLSHRVVVLKEGRIVEQGDTRRILHHPQDGYTQRLVAAVPVPDPVEQRARRAHRRSLAAAPGSETVLD